MSFSKQLEDLRAAAVEVIGGYVEKNGSITVRNLGSAHRTPVSCTAGNLYIGSHHVSVVHADTLVLIADMLNAMP